jgi:SnoaL-like protein
MAGDGAETRQRFRSAIERRDHAAVVSLLAPGVVLHSPIIGSAAFEGRQAVGDVLGAVLATFEDIRYTAEGEAEDGELEVLVFRARVRRVDIETVDLVRVDGEGLITEFTVVIRPMAGLAAVAVALGPHIARGPVRGVLVRVLATPLAVLLRLVDPLVGRLIRLRS